MTRLFLFLIAVATAIAAFGALSAQRAQAQTTGSLGNGQIERPVLRGEIVVNSAIVRIGDLVEHAGAKADVAVFRAPDPGTSGAVSVSAILDALSTHDVIAVDTRGLGEVTVTRPSNAVTAEHLKERIASALAHRGGLGEAKDLTIRFDGEIAPVEIDPSHRDDLRLVRAAFNPQTAQFDALFVFTPPNGNAQRLRYTGTAQELVTIAILSRSQDRGAVLRESDLTTEQRPRSQASNEYVGLAQAIGKSLKRPLRAGQPLRDSDLSRPELVHRGEAVVIVYRTEGIYLTIRGKAEESGALGDIVGITNLQTKRTIQGTVSGPGEVTVSPARRISANASTTRQAALNSSAAVTVSAE